MNSERHTLFMVAIFINLVLVIIESCDTPKEISPINTSMADNPTQNAIYVPTPSWDRVIFSVVNSVNMKTIAEFATNVTSVVFIAQFIQKRNTSIFVIILFCIEITTSNTLFELPLDINLPFYTSMLYLPPGIHLLNQYTNCDAGVWKMVCPCDAIYRLLAMQNIVGYKFSLLWNLPLLFSELGITDTTNDNDGSDENCKRKDKWQAAVDT